MERSEIYFKKLNFANGNLTLALLASLVFAATFIKETMSSCRNCRQKVALLPSCNPSSQHCRRFVKIKSWKQEQETNLKIFGKNAELVVILLHSHRTSRNHFAKPAASGRHERHHHKDGEGKE